ncbi:Glutamate synthase [NADPH] small chain [Salinivirga cyanobacteriivorans]|uniref:Glutamate synthase [NADPH] small chain n=1 Tax=Salinivirga cyanobacteriivorans TaxID=1307839 RepID=A0A0S2HVG0_9BACT|nr:molybdopterin-dependent oxidoreductase [Salinivirga cyanobacteriivorans]ALO14041.1 Glutamate synthase [NADPH] small chain [Salinivirga cyanobacteriivorans]
MSDKVNIILNGKHTTANADETILEMAKQHDIQIPTLCFDERLKPNSSCYVCVVEVEQNGKKSMQPSCSTFVNEGMHINTSNEAVKKSRKTALELMLSNHYADCVGPCKEECPAGVDVQGYISLIEKERYSDAIGLIKETNPLPAICGRVCVRPCEVACRRNLLDEDNAVGIDYLKRFAADQDFASENYYSPEVAETTGKKVAIIGAGPGGLSAAWFLQQKGHQCDIYEAQPHAGGWLRYGIPEYRLPNDILDKEVERITELGVNIHYNQKLGDNLSYAQLDKDYDATILTIGSQRGTLLRAEGEDAENVFSGIDFLRNMEMTGQRYDFKGKKVAVVGGGNTAMDCCRTAIRCGSTDVKVIYRRTEKEMPANPIEIHESKLEGVDYNLLTNPVKVNKDEQGRVKSMTLIKMELGEPDESGRRRPKPIEGSEYDEEFDYILAAIGQKTDINFLDDINNHSSNGELLANRWGDIDADEQTLQTSIPSVFAAGDGVTGPATIIEAVAQAKTAAHSCHQFLIGEEIKPEPREFFSRKANFKKQEKKDYLERYQNQQREEMPTLPESERVNFNEVELGYAGEAVAKRETGRCLECGCSALHTCDLKAYATEYQAEQMAFEGEFNDFETDHSHPFIEIDNNKCILCTRCVRICKNVVGANALGLVERGFETYIAPSMGNSLNETNCESCGMCISACPTGAITENVLFKPLPVKTEVSKTLCNYCSIGCELEIHHKNGFVTTVEGAKGTVNKDGNICRYARFGYHYLNDKERITKPLIKENGKFRPVEFTEVFAHIKKQFSEGEGAHNALFAGARLSNEELYLAGKLARKGMKTENIGSFHYLGREYGYVNNNRHSVPFDQLKDGGKFFLLGSEINKDNAVAGFMVQQQVVENEKPLVVITEKEQSAMSYKADENIHVKSYYHLVKAMNHYLVNNGKENRMFIDAQCADYEKYKSNLLSSDYKELVKQSGISENAVEKLADAYNLEPNAIMIFSEKEVDPATSQEVLNLAMITGKLGKTAMGVVVLKEKNNSQGLLDMGIAPSLKIGGMKPEKTDDTLKMKVQEGAFKNIMILGEDPVGTAKNQQDIAKLIDNASFIVVQDAFMTETAKQADVILPASFTIESSGSYTNTNRFIQQYTQHFSTKTEKTTFHQLVALLEQFGIETKKDAAYVMDDIARDLPGEVDNKLNFIVTERAGDKAMFNNGADFINKKFDEMFEKAFTGKRVEVEASIYG